jgi:hypothetical protein
MREQINFSRTYPFQQFMAGLPALESAAAIIHGVIIDLHPVWKWAVDYQRTTGTVDDPHAPIRPIHREDMAHGPYDPAFIEGEPVNRQWFDFCGSHGKKLNEPFLVRVWVVPTTDQTRPLRRAVEDYARRAPFFVAVEERPMASLATNVEGGKEITVTRSGTLGGFLKDPSGDKWGVTCGHVAQSVNSSVTIEDIGGVQYVGAGTVAQTTFPPQASSQTGVCNQYVDNSHPDVDAAIIKFGAGFTGLDSIVTLGSIDEIYDRMQLQAGSTVWMTGPRSGTHDYVIAGYGVTIKVDFKMPTGTSLYCFSHLFTFHDPGHSPNWMPGKIAQARTNRPLRGDSGAWVCYKKPQNYAYFGNLIAVQGALGIATFADALIDWADKQHSLKLSPV